MSTPNLLIITDGRKGHCSDVESDDDVDFLDTPPNRQKTSRYFHPSIEERTTHEYFSTEPEGLETNIPIKLHETRADAEPDVTNVEQTMDKKGKGKIDPADDIEYPYFPPTPSFNLGIDSTPIISNIVSMDEMFKSKEVLQQVDSIIAGVVKETGVEEQVGVTTTTITKEQVVL
ncbi:Hypothetical predicted protein [Olea europaea subsp. europaea]|uniref:Uncharacterized protein n=1 Tax=Olea europaea subsp. europaea TaxID=158383 RepID=A0A8S0USZ5_OLEEU|nr:Hypothetical predicted protein [Olea europaea subsp. europaea]